jgi:hypothetical protein
MHQLPKRNFWIMRRRQRQVKETMATLAAEVKFILSAYGIPTYIKVKQ